MGVYSGKAKKGGKQDPVLDRSLFAFFQFLSQTANLSQDNTGNIRGIGFQYLDLSGSITHISQKKKENMRSREEKKRIKNSRGVRVQC